jgi:hypothetical protein
MVLVGVSLAVMSARLLCAAFTYAVARPPTHY